MKKTMLKTLLLSALVLTAFSAKPTMAFADAQSDLSSINDQITVLQGQLDDVSKKINEKQADLDTTDAEIQKRDKIIEKVDTQLENTEERNKKDIKELANELSTKIIESQTTSLISGDNKVSNITMHPLSFSLLEDQGAEGVGQVKLENATLEETKQDIIQEKNELSQAKEEKSLNNDELLSKKDDIESNISNLQQQKEDAERALRIFNKYGISVSSKNSDILETSFQFLGLPYVWGGTSPVSGFDCSGFTQYVYAQHGIYLPRTTYDQINCGTEVKNRSDLQPGDLIFPHTGHVQIYIGNGQVIHAPHTGDVIKISSLGSYVSARHIR